MFERYTEHARRMIFFARFEASRFGSPYIETEHLLLGALRDPGALAGSVTPEQAAAIRQAVESQLTSNTGVSTSADLPLSHAAKRALAYGAEEAEKLGHGFIDVAHLLMGILREPECTAAKVLREHGITVQPPQARSGGFIGRGGGGATWSMPPEGRLIEGTRSRSYGAVDGQHVETNFVIRGRSLKVHSHIKVNGDDGTYTIRVFAGPKQYCYEIEFRTPDLPESE